MFKAEKKIVSRPWIFISFFIFIGLEILLGGVAGRILAGKFVSHVLHFKIELILILVSYFLGGLIIGFASPNIRILEPALGAFFAVFFTFLYSFFTPLRFFGFSLSRILIGGVIAFLLALFGADLGERAAARIGNSKSKRYISM